MIQRALLRGLLRLVALLPLALAQAIGAGIGWLLWRIPNGPRQVAERTARPRDLFWPWFAANVSVFGMSYGSFVLGFGISFWQATVVSIVGIVVSFLLCGLIAIAGKRGSAPTMVLSRAAFGVHGQKVPGIVSWLTSLAR